MISKRYLLSAMQVVIPLVFLAVLVIGCEQHPKPIKIGMSINLSGRGGAAGEHIRDGALLAVDEVNRNGGINGRPLVLLVRDDENNVEGIHKADASLVKEGVVAIIGHSYSANTIEAYPYITAHNTLMITGYTATTTLSGKDDLFFRTSIDCNLYGRKTAALLAKKNVTSVSFLMDMTNPDFVVDYVEHVKKNYQGGVTTVQFKSRDNVDWDKVTTELMAKQPQAIIMLTESSMTAVAVQMLKEHHFPGDIIGTIWTQSPELIRIGGPATEGISIVSFINPENHRPDYLDFSDKLQKHFGKSATARSARAYEMINILTQGLRKCDVVSAAHLKTALLNDKFNSILGPVQFDASGDCIRPVYDVVVKDGRFINAGEIY